MEGYKNNVPGVLHVCGKVPTAGGKTFLATIALKPTLDTVPSTDQPIDGAHKLADALVLLGQL